MVEKKLPTTRREYLVSSSALATAFAGTSVAKSDNGKRNQSQNGVLITNSNGTGIFKNQVEESRKEVLNKRENSSETVILSTIDELFQQHSSKDLVGYYIGWDEEKEVPEEHIWSKPNALGKHAANEIAGRAKKTVDNGLQSSSDYSTSTSYADDPIDAGPGWEHKSTVSTDGYFEGELDSGTYTVGRLDLKAEIFEAPKVNGKHQLGVVLSFLSWPGQYLDDHDSSVSNGRGLHHKTKAKQNWANNPDAEQELVDFSPSSESGNCLSLDSVTIGASASGINGTVNLSVGNDSVNSIDNQSDPDVTVETVYEYGNWWGGDNCGGENVISAGNAGVFLWDGKKDHGYNIMSNNIIGTFEARDSKGGVVVTDDIGYAFSTINTEL